MTKMKQSAKAMQTLSAAVRRFARDESGLAMVEYAMTLPFMAGMFVGFGALATGQHANNRVSDVGKTVSDIVSQSPALDRAQIDAALLAGEAIAGTAQARKIKIEVIGVNIANNGTARVAWARGRNTNNLPRKNSIYPMPASLKNEQKFVVVSKASMSYAPSVGSSLVGTIPFSYTYYFIPRVSYDTICGDC